MLESIYIFFVVIAGITAFVVGNRTIAYLIVLAFYILIYSSGLIITILGVFMFTAGGGLGAFGIMVIFFGVLISTEIYFKCACESCKFGLKMLRFGKMHDSLSNSFNQCTVGTKCLKCGNKSCWNTPYSPPY